MPTALIDALDLVWRATRPGRCPATAAQRDGRRHQLAQLRPYEIGDDVRQIDRQRQRARALHACVPSTLTTWIVLDVSPSMAFGTAQRLKADVAEGVALVLGT
jgi:uncharacterized protein (DUF58 family)